MNVQILLPSIFIQGTFFTYFLQQVYNIKAIVYINILYVNLFRLK